MAEIAEFIEDHDELGAEFLAYYSNIEEARKALFEQYTGVYKSVADFAESLTGDTTQVSESLKFYIDYERMGRDMEMSGDIFTIETGFEEVHMFWSR